jgi:hypothetical protein
MPKGGSWLWLMFGIIYFRLNVWNCVSMAFKCKSLRSNVFWIKAFLSWCRSPYITFLKFGLSNNNKNNKWNVKTPNLQSLCCREKNSKKETLITPLGQKIKKCPIYNFEAGNLPSSHVNFASENCMKMSTKSQFWHYKL